MRKIAIQILSNSIRITETRIDGVVLLPINIGNDYSYKLIPNIYNRFDKDSGFNTYQIINSNGGGVFQPARYFEYEIDGVSCTSEEDLFDKFANLKPFGIPSSSGDLSNILDEIKKIVPAEIIPVSFELPIGTYTNTNILVGNYSGTETKINSIEVLAADAESFILDFVGDLYPETTLSSQIVSAGNGLELPSFTLTVLIPVTVNLLLLK